MPLVALVIVGVAVGLLARHIFRLRMDTPSVVALGVIGALIGPIVLRGAAMFGRYGVGLVGALLGALILIWAWKAFAR